MTRFALIALVRVVGCNNKAPRPEAPKLDQPSPGGSAQPGTACDALDETACRANLACAAIEASPLGQDGSCSQPSKVVGCHAADTACAEALTYAVDGSGKGWWFGDTCIPGGYTAQAADRGDRDPPATRRGRSGRRARAGRRCRGRLA